MINKVAVYCRVSTGKEDQANSFESQKNFFEYYVSKNPDWQLYDIYADKGVSGTTIEKRIAFKSMINDALLGKFSLIITKSVDRFARNIKDTLNIIFDLKKVNVNVIFLTNRIDTRDSDYERQLVSAALTAQEESTFNSQRIKFGQRYQMEQGVVFGHSLLGFDVKNGKLSINPEGAEVVRLIFQKYGIEKKGTSVIARELREAGYRTTTGNPIWENSYILKVLTNEKYVGDLVQQKTITPDCLDHKKKYNHDAATLVLHEEHHEAIIDRELWDTVQAEIKKRNVHGEQGDGHSNRYAFSGKIKCGNCGSSFSPRKKTLKDGSFYRRWSCSKSINQGKQYTDMQGNELGCDIGKTIREDLAVEMMQTAIKTIPMDMEKIIQNVASLASKAICASEDHNPDRDWMLENEIADTLEKKKNVLDTYFAKIINETEMRMMCDKYDCDLAALQERLDNVHARANTANSIAQRQNTIEKQLTDIALCKIKSDVYIKNILDKMVVYHDGHVELSLNNLPQKWDFELE